MKVSIVKGFAVHPTLNRQVKNSSCCVSIRSACSGRRSEAIIREIGVTFTFTWYGPGETIILPDHVLVAEYRSVSQQDGVHLDLHIPLELPPIQGVAPGRLQMIDAVLGRVQLVLWGIRIGEATCTCSREGGASTKSLFVISRK